MATLVMVDRVIDRDAVHQAKPTPATQADEGGTDVPLGRIVVGKQFLLAELITTTAGENLKFVFIDGALKGTLEGIFLELKMGVVKLLFYFLLITWQHAINEV